MNRMKQSVSGSAGRLCHRLRADHEFPLLKVSSKIAVMLWLCLWGTLPCRSQGDEPWMKYFGQLTTIDEAEDESWEQTCEVLSEFYAHPIDLNTATRADLAQLPFLSNQQISAIINYRDQYGPVRSKNELLLIPGMEYAQSRLLQFFITLSGDKEKPFPNGSDLLHKGRHDLTGYFKAPFYTRDGDRSGFLGYRYKHWLRWSYGLADRVRAGITVSQDAGEPFFEGRNSCGYDYLTAYFDVRKIGILRQAVVGRYRLKTGMGLILNNDYGFGKLATLASLGRNSFSLHGHGSRSEGNYLQGAAVTLQPSRMFSITAFASWRKIDATLSADSSAITTIVTSGYHRTRTEMDKKHNTSEGLVGGRFGFNAAGFHVGLTTFAASLSRRLQPLGTQSFRRYYPRGDRFWNMSADYGYAGSKLNFSGETATGDCHAWAIINTLSLQAMSNLQFVVLQRFYSYRFYSLFSRSFSDGGRVQNESGCYAGAIWSPLRGLTVTAYADYAYHPWASYRVSKASHATDFFLEANLSRGAWTTDMRWRMRRRQRDNDDKTALTSRDEQRGRLYVDYSADAFSLRAQADVASCSGTSHSWGWMTSLRGACRLRHFRLQALAGYFHTDDYDSRVYSADPPLLYSFYFPVFYGQGWHGVASGSWMPSENFSLEVRAATTKYLDRSVVGSSYTRIQGSSAPYLEVQARVRIHNGKL